MEKIKEIIKKIFAVVFGTSENIMTKINLSCLMIGILFFIFAVAQGEMGVESKYFNNVSAIFLAIWLISIKGIDLLIPLCFEYIRIVVFMIIFLCSFTYLLNYISSDNQISGIRIGLATIGAFLCICYFICKIVDIFNFAKKIFIQIKKKLFNTDELATSKFKLIIENCTAFFVTISGLAIAVKTLLETVFQLINFITK